MKVISETCHARLIQYLHLYWCDQVPDESYSRNVSYTLNSISTFLLMYIYSEQMSECLLFNAHSEQLNQLYQFENK